MNVRTFQRRSVLDRAPGSGMPNMTPMVDVTLVILIFFMASSAIVGPEWFLPASLPESGPASSALALPSPVVRAEVFTRDGAVIVRGLGPEAPLEDAIASVGSLDPAVARGLVVEIDASDDAPYAAVARLHAVLVERGAQVRFNADE